MHDQSEDLGYDSFNAVLILGTILLFALIYVVRVILYAAFMVVKSVLKAPVGSKYEGG